MSIPTPLMIEPIGTGSEVLRTARAAQEAHEALEREWETPQVPEVSEMNFDEFELMERSWLGTVPAGLELPDRAP